MYEEAEEGSLGAQVEETLKRIWNFSNGQKRASDTIVTFVFGDWVSALITDRTIGHVGETKVLLVCHYTGSHEIPDLFHTQDSEEGNNSPWVFNIFGSSTGALTFPRWA